MHLKQIRFYESEYLNYWLLTPEGNNELSDIEVYIQGTEQGPDESRFQLACDILDKHWRKVMDLALNRLHSWAEDTEKGYEASCIYIGDYPYGPQAGRQHGFKLTLKTTGSDCEDIYGEFTINFNQNIWPIGYEFSIA